jgi:hypothetical protein
MFLLPAIHRRIATEQSTASFQYTKQQAYSDIGFLFAYLPRLLQNIHIQD